MAGNKARQNLSSNGDPIQALYPKPEGTVEITTGNRSSEISSNIVRILAKSGLPRIRFGDSAVVADSTDLLLVVDVPEYFSINPGDYIGVLGGTVEVSIMQT